jgi:hypothetical protein
MPCVGRDDKRRDFPCRFFDLITSPLDNRFIFETVVGSIRATKKHRQMIFVIHNSSMPVLADAERVAREGWLGFLGRRRRCQQFYLL